LFRLHLDEIGYSTDTRLLVQDYGSFLVKLIVSLTSMYILSSIFQLESLASKPSLKLTALHNFSSKASYRKWLWRMYRLKRILKGLKKP